MTSICNITETHGQFEYVIAYVLTSESRRGWKSSKNLPDSKWHTLLTTHLIYVTGRIIGDIGWCRSIRCAIFHLKRDLVYRRWRKQIFLNNLSSTNKDKNSSHLKDNSKRYHRGDGGVLIHNVGINDLNNSKSSQHLQICKINDGTGKTCKRFRAFKVQVSLVLFK